MDRQNTKPHKKRSRYDAHKLQLLHDFRLLAILILIIFLAFRFLIGFSAVSGVSMLDTLHDGEKIFYTRVNGPISHGDVISVRIPTGEYYIKRVIAIGGDTVDLRDGVLYVNGQAETGSYVRGQTLPEGGAFSYPFTVPQGDLFVLGDNREESIDSRSFGCVSARQIKGIVRFSFGLFYIHPM